MKLILCTQRVFDNLKGEIRGTKRSQRGRNFPAKSLKFVFKAFNSDQAFGDFLDTFSTFCYLQKKLVNKSFKFLGIEKEYFKKISIYDLV